ncbi:hypothetical protein ZIOFF_030379 [Zingiber officinale]|uniref:Mediator of RNA polymerase II transcription subunit 11 n=2 Tax=Zingiber officinale TaxID=94328 RepID=A0A8J5GPC9_ZINOF|nr:hypothetical protein ZIOFF_030379 [Zingiber officinale]
MLNLLDIVTKNWLRLPSSSRSPSPAVLLLIGGRPNYRSTSGSSEMDSQPTSLQRLHNVEKRLVRVLELAGAVMDELASSTGPRAEFLAGHCREFMMSIKEIQTTLREEIKSACEYRPFEKCDYSARIANEICVKKLEYIIDQLDGLKESIDNYED